MKKQIKKYVSLLLVVVMVIGLVPISSYADPLTWQDVDVIGAGFAGGTGESGDPYLIENVGQLAYFAKSVSDGTDYQYKKIELKSDILLSDREWIPIGTQANKFKGSFNGNGYSVTGMTINSGDNYVGFFKFNEGSIINLALKNININSTLSGLAYVGGLAGANLGSISDCYVTGDIVATGDCIGGLVGYNSNLIENCYTNVTVSGNSIVAGIAGSMVGGSSMLISSFALGSANAPELALGKIVAENAGEVASCYYLNWTEYPVFDTEIVSYGEYSQFVEESFYTTDSNWDDRSLWDFVDIWEMGDDYPLLKQLAVEVSSVPDAPTELEVKGGYNQVFLSYDEPNDGGSSITGYKVGVYVDDMWESDFASVGTENPIKVTGLTNGITYKFKLIAINANGESDASVFSGEVIPELTDYSQVADVAVQDVDYSISGDTYTVYTDLGLAWIASQVNAYVGDPDDGNQLNDFSGKTIELANDIDLSVYDEKNLAWTPIGGWYTEGDEDDSDLVFNGTFDGKEHSVTGMLMIAPNNLNEFQPSTKENAGLFGIVASDALIKNLSVQGNVFTTGDYIGILAGLVEGGQIENCDVTGMIGVGNSTNLRHFVGGLVGYLDNGAISDSIADVVIDSAEVESNGSIYLGGFVGISDNSIISNSIAKGEVSIGDVNQVSSAKVGGFAASVEDSIISNCSAEGSVLAGDALANGSANLNAGGFTAYNDAGTISNCTATGSVTVGDILVDSYGDILAGGFTAEAEGDIYNSSAKGNVVGGSGFVGDDQTSYVTLGGFVGEHVGGDIENNYARGNVTGGDYAYVGGFVGTEYGSRMQNLYATGDTIGGENSIVGGFVAYDDDETSWSYAYYNSDATQTISTVVSSVVLDRVSNSSSTTAKSEADMLNSTFAVQLSDNIDNINMANDATFEVWLILEETNDGYPIFNYEAPVVEVDSNVRHMAASGNVFLGGKYIELGIAPSGYFGTTVAAPVLYPAVGGFHPFSAYGNKLGMQVDGDGFDIGNAPTTGDFFLPGSPTEGFGLGYKLTGEGVAVLLKNYNGAGVQGITNITSVDASSGNTLRAITTGTIDGVIEIKQEVWFEVNDKIFQTKISVKNLSGASLFDVRYTRSVDPDQDKDLNNTYVTKNSVISNPPASGSAVVIAKGNVTNEPFIYMSSDPTARAAIAPANMLDPYDVSLWLQDGNLLLRAETAADTGIHLTFKIGDVAAGETKTVTMSNSLNPDLDEALGDLNGNTNSVPDAPTLTTLTPGNTTASVAFTTPISDGGAAITNYTVKVYKEGVEQTSLNKTGTASPITVTGLTNGTAYTFKVIATNSVGNSLESNASSAVTPVAPVSSSGGTTTPVVVVPATVIVIVNGVPQNSGTETKTTEQGKTVVTVQLNNKTIEDKINEAIKTNPTGIGNILQVPVADTTSNIAKVVLTGDIVKKLETNTYNLSIKRDNVDYVIPAKELTISKIAASLGVAETSLKDISIEVKITKLDATVVAKYDAVAKANGAQLVFPPMEFEIVAKTTSADGTTKNVSISKFSNYVQRVMEIPAGVDPSKITTGIVFNVDGTYSHVPTEVFEKDGKWFAKLNSLTNSNYSVIWNPITVASVENHWSKDAVNDMASRLVIFNPEKFDPNKAISRADFAEYIIKALGLYREGAVLKNNFSDVANTDTRALAILIANENSIITGYADGTFKPAGLITREEAMTMYSRAMKVTQLVGKDSNRYSGYSDYFKTSGWARPYVMDVLSAHVFNGTTETTISPKSILTHGEAAQAIKNLLVESKLINK